MAWLWPKKLFYEGWSWLVQVAPYADSVAWVPVWTNDVELITALDLLSYKDVWDFQSPVFTTTKDNEQEYRSGKCNVWTFAQTFEQKESLDLSIMDINDPQFLEMILWWNYTSTLTQKIRSYAFQSMTAPQLVVKFTSCDLNWYGIDYAVDATTKLVDTIYIVKCTASSAIPRQYFYWSKETLEWSAVTFSWELGWYMIHKREELSLVI